MAHLPLEACDSSINLPSTFLPRAMSSYFLPLILARVRYYPHRGLFKESLALQGWNVSAWLEEDSDTGLLSLQEKLEHWMRIDHVYFKTVQLFEEAAAANHFSKSPFEVDSDGNSQEPELDHQISQIPNNFTISLRFILS